MVKARPEETRTMEQERAKLEQFLTFFVGGEEVAINILQIREVIAYQPPTRIPVAPAHLRGVINLRGAVVPVVELALRLGLAVAPVSKNTCVVVVEVIVDGKLTMVGVVVESVGQVVDLALSDIEPPPTFGMALQPSAVLGLGRLEARFIPILDIDALLAERVALHAALEGGKPDAPLPELPPQSDAAEPGEAAAPGLRAP
ncbi:chemotaxis protein CheW [Sorangium sp. So ce1153]|uniref:chemotaxis protein CheW n=1 Tax=Sorangium sp. So ce1153 TaxID=3133333 RepID=UPI003F62F00B